jgi:glycosyltransferase involved in cell wall biosynthesis
LVESCPDALYNGANPECSGRSGRQAAHPIVTTLRRIALAGPFPPIRSGVARHTAALARALGARADVVVGCWGFRRQYPALLYPGADERQPQATAAAGVEETLDGVNPLSWERTARAVRAWRPDTIVTPAWTFFLAPALARVAAAGGGAGAARCVIVHNAFDHEGAAWKRALSLRQLAGADRFVTHNAALAETLRERFPRTPTSVFPHPVFDDFPEPAGALPRRAALELLFFGLVRPYKGLDILVEALALSGRRDVRLTVAGEFWEGLAAVRARVAELGLSDLVELIPRYVGDAEAAEYFRRADAVVLPYRSVTGSGVVANALHYGRAVVASDLPGLAEVVRDGETGWLFEAGDSGALAAVLRTLDRERAAQAGDAARAFGRTLSWDRFAEVVLAPPPEASA